MRIGKRTRGAKLGGVTELVLTLQAHVGSWFPGADEVGEEVQAPRQGSGGGSTWLLLWLAIPQDEIPSCDILRPTSHHLTSPIVLLPGDSDPDYNEGQSFSIRFSHLTISLALVPRSSPPGEICHAVAPRVWPLITDPTPT
jgi:hypothetical protein